MPNKKHKYPRNKANVKAQSNKVNVKSQKDLDKMNLEIANEIGLPDHDKQYTQFDYPKVSTGRKILKMIQNQITGRNNIQ
jgi:hypothetical protein